MLSGADTTCRRASAVRGLPLVQEARRMVVPARRPVTVAVSPLPLTVAMGPATDASMVNPTVHPLVVGRPAASRKDTRVVAVPFDTAETVAVSVEGVSTMTTAGLPLVAMHCSVVSATRLIPEPPIGPIACTVTVPGAPQVARPAVGVIPAIPGVPRMLHAAVVNAGRTALYWSRTSMAYWRVAPTRIVPVVGADVTRMVIVVATGGGTMHCSDASAVRLVPDPPTGPIACTVTVPTAVHVARPPVEMDATPAAPTMLHAAVVSAGSTTLFWS